MAPKKVTPRGSAAAPPGSGIETPVATKKPAQAKPKTASTRGRSTRKYMRNIRGIQARALFDNGRRITLNPRGQRGDMTSVSKEDLEDEKFLANMGLLYEIIDEKEANEIREKQSTNQSAQPGHPSQRLTDEKGNPISFGGTANSLESQGITVATITESGPTKNLAQEEALQRVGPRQVEVPGSTPIQAHSFPPILDD